VSFAVETTAARAADAVAENAKRSTAVVQALKTQVAAEDTLTVGESAVVKAKITGTSVIVHGQVTGDISARTRLELRAPSKVVGNITSASLVIHEGGVFEGQCAMGGVEGQHADKDKDRKVALFPKEERPTEVPAIKS